MGNQFALTSIIGTLFSLPLMIAREGHKWGGFVELFKENADVRNNLITSGLYFYLYNELATLTIKKTNAVTQSVANTAKRVIVIVGVAIVMKESSTRSSCSAAPSGSAASSCTRSSTSWSTASRR